MSTVPVVRYEAPAGYELDVELYPAPELRRRAALNPTRIERLDFYVLLFVARAGYTHMVDFESLSCRAGSVVLVQPGRVHRFGDLNRFHGWMLIFRSELLTPSLGRAELPAHTELDREQRAAVLECLQRMASDAARGSPFAGELLGSQVPTLLLRIAQASDETTASPRIERTVLERFQRYRALVEREHHQWHSVKRYARALGCSEKSLTRATRQAVGMSAKELLTNRLVLESKRRLAHSATPVALIGDELGFSEPTNFVKFFRRETRMTPGAFRHSQRPELVSRETP